MRLFNTYLLIFPAVMLYVVAGSAYAGNVSITTTNNQRCISSDGLPDHSTGSFPNSGNPHRISTQSIRYCFPLNPVKNNPAIPQRGSIGVALNGITIRPGTAYYWDASSSRGHSRDRSSGWNLEGLGSCEALGIDHNNAHVDNRGLYHYHGVASALVSSQADTLIAYAADGFEIHYVGRSERASYQLKQGTRPSGPGGRYDGTYVEDWQYIAGSGTLDHCNGGTLNGKFVYFATDIYPFFPRCLWGNVSNDFGHQGQAQRDSNRSQDRSGRRPPPHRHGHPPSRRW